MKFKSLILLASVLLLSGFTIVFDDKKTKQIPAGPDGDAARNAERLEQTFESKLLPRIRGTALGVKELEALLKKDGLEAVGATSGNKGSGRGAAWNYSVADKGKIVAAKLDTSARRLSVDVDGDEKADVTVQLGPVIKGTALRDVSPFYNFDDFRDQIEFAKLARALNDRIKPGLVVPEGALVGKTVTFVGVVPLKKVDADYILTPIEVEFDE